MTNLTRPDNYDSLEELERIRSSPKEMKRLNERMKHWIDNNIYPPIFYPEITELLIKEFIRKFGTTHENAQLIESELKKARPKGRRPKYSKSKVKEEFRMLKESPNNSLSYKERLQYLAKQYLLPGDEAWKVIENLINTAKKNTPKK